MNNDKVQMSLEPIVKKQILDVIGDISEISLFRAKRLWDYNWRVDIWCRTKSETELSIFKSARIKYSYFIKTDEAGNIISSDPELKDESN